MGKIQIDPKFSKNWKTFEQWYAKQSQNGRTFNGAPWMLQKQFITAAFEKTMPGLIEWRSLWLDLERWTAEIRQKKTVLWSEQKRQIETLILNQIKELDTPIFVVAWITEGGVPEIDSTKSTYWEALRIKKSLEGDSNGVGGNENVDKITIINLKRLLA